MMSGKPGISESMASQGGGAVRILVSISLVVFGVGCGNLAGVVGVVGALGLGSDKITLRLVNNTTDAVEPSVFVSSVIGDLLIDALTEEVVTLSINRQDFSDLAVGEARTVRYDCDDFKAMMVDNAELKSALVQPDADSDLLIEDRDFDCGDFITIRYSGGVTSFRVSVTAEPFDTSGLIDVLLGS